MNVLSLFDGMSCGQIALNRIGVTPGKYYAAEIDKYAIKVTQANYPNTIQLGSVTEWREWDLDWSTIDFVSGGFPCQAWSMAGKQLGDKDERGMLFWTMLDIIRYAKKCNPKIKFLIENVKMKKEFEDYITHHTEEALGEVNKVLINSALVSAQNRRRFYWTNWHVEQPEDKSIVLADVIDDGFVDRNKSRAIISSIGRTTEREYFKKNQGQLVSTIRIATASDIKGHDYNKRIYSVHGKCPTLCAGGGGNLEPKILTSEITDSLIFERKKHYRKVTPTECERLQTVPDGYTNHVSNTQRYKMLGNGWTVDVIAHIYSQMELPIKVFARQLDLFEE
jgi:DNA-cytosine methyltransferase